MTTTPWLDDGLRRLRALWRDFWARPWRFKGPALAVFAIVLALVIVLPALALMDGGGSGSAVRNPSQQTFGGAPSYTAIPTATPTPKPKPTPTPTVTPTPTPAPSGGSGNGGGSGGDDGGSSGGGGGGGGGGATATPIAGNYSLATIFGTANYQRMIAFTLIPGTNSAAVATQGGGVYRVPLGGGAPSQMGNVSSLLIDSPGNEEGLLGIAFSPGFTSDDSVYLYYTSDSGCPGGFSRCSHVSRFTVSNGGSGSIQNASEEVLLNVGQPYPNHNGGQLVFGPDGRLYVTLGDGGDAGDPLETGQNPNDLLGSIVRLNVSSGSAEVFAYGLRNPWRATFDRLTGDMWAGDVGQNAWEEVDRIVQGGNYGWDCYEGNAVYESAGCGGGNFRAPRAVYGHDLGCSVTGGYVYRGSAMPELYGWYVYGDYCSGRIWAVNTSGSAPPVLLLDSSHNISSFGELPSGELIVVTFSNALYKLTR